MPEGVALAGQSGGAPGKAKREVAIVAVDEKTFTVDANHPLAGKDLTFDVELLGIDR